jgi:mRNA interferase YafQ
VRRELHPSSAFTRSIKRLGKKDRGSFDFIRSILELLENDAFDARLGSHKLKGDLDGPWTCSAGYDLRIAFEIGKRNDNEVILPVVGTYDEVY